MTGITLEMAISYVPAIENLDRILFSQKCSSTTYLWSNFQNVKLCRKLKACLWMWYGYNMGP